MRTHTFRWKNFQVCKNSSWITFRVMKKQHQNSEKIIFGKSCGEPRKMNSTVHKITGEQIWYPWSYFKWFGDHTIRIWWANNGENGNSTNPISEICVKFVGCQNKVYMEKLNILCCKTCFETSNFRMLTIGMSSDTHYHHGTHPENRNFGHF